MHKRTISLRTIGFATCILVASALAASSVGAQVVPAQTFTSAGADASPIQSSMCNTGTLQVTGTGTWTIVPQGSNDNGLTYVTVPTINSGAVTGSGTFSGSIAGYASSFFRFNVTAVNGSVTVTKSCTSQILPSAGGGGASGTPGSSGASAQYVQGVPGGFPIPISGSITAMSTYPFNAAQSQAAQTASFAGAACEFFTAVPTLTNGQVNPCSVDANGYLNVHIQSGGSGGGSTYPYGVASAAPTTASFVGVSGFDGTYARPISIDPATGAILTKSTAAVNGTYGAPNATVTASATSVQYQQGTGPNGSIVAPFPGNADTSTAGVGQNIGLSAYNGASFDRLRTTQAFQSPAPIGVAAVDTCGYNAVTSSNTCSGQLQNTADGVSTQQLSDTAAFMYGFGNGGFDRIRTVQNVMTSATGVGRLATGICDPSASSCASVSSGALTVGGTVSLGAGAATIGSIGNTAFGTAAVTGVGATRYATVANTTNTVQGICTTACTAYDLSAINTTAAICYIQEFAVSTASVTLGTTAPARIVLVPASGYAADNIPSTIGDKFATAWSYATTTTPTGSTACGSSVYVQADYI